MISRLEQIMEELKQEMHKVERGNDSAAVRARKLLQDLRDECKSVRVAIQDWRNREIF
jgi:hypothetical protein